jgi:hypothetical protein
MALALALALAHAAAVERRGEECSVQTGPAKRRIDEYLTAPSSTQRTHLRRQRGPSAWCSAAASDFLLSHRRSIVDLVKAPHIQINGEQ